ncbi:MAG: Alanine--tRNA ligase [Candidatus Heimdallarchaeota archaeon LC_3]|nr:MAG: Alanine--tRNA ligase [Candidatus Heimdallarchaeota archaeon LC_3]
MSSQIQQEPKILSDKEIKKKMKPIFHKNYQKFYPVDKLDTLGFKRNICTNCGRGFWSTVDREVCDESVCVGGYRFIGKPLTTKRLGYKETWDAYVDIFKQWDYKPIKRYPVVSRWYDALEFTAAGINVFQPYIVQGKQDPPYQRVLEPQMCLRFNDLDNVGITGTHYSAFIMVGQHVFNSKKLGESYWIEDGIEQIYIFLNKRLGISSHDLIFMEDVWSGGGNYGPSMEFFAGGMELGNQVYIQFDSATMEQLDTRVIDMGAGLERWSWFCSDKPTSYETTFPLVLNYLYNQSGYKPNKDIWTHFMKYAGLLNVDETDNISESWKEVAKKIGLTKKELDKEIYPIRALYTIADHTRNLLFAIRDGALPSNVGGGYNLRNILRRCYSFIDEFEFKFDFHKIFELHIEELGEWFPELKETGSLYDILDLEKKRYSETTEKNKKSLKRLLKGKTKVTIDTFIDLYDSQGITPELVKQYDPTIDIPHDFYLRVQERHEQKKVVEKTFKLTSSVPKTKQLYYENTYGSKKSFKANILDIINNEWIVLDKTHFYPEGGGQAADIGTINSEKVIDVQSDSDIIFHKVKKTTKLKINQKITAQIDWFRRYELMKLHSGTHLVNAVAYDVLGKHIFQAGAKKSPGKAHLDLTHFKSLTQDEIDEIERRVNYYINSEPIKSTIKIYPRDQAEAKFSTSIYAGGAIPSTNLRIVSFKDNEACSGTHLNSTGEIGFLKITSAERIQDGIVRLTYVIGQTAVQRVQKQESLLRDLSEIWKVGFDDIPKTGIKFFEEWKKLGKEVKSLQTSLISSVLKTAVEGKKDIEWVQLPFRDQGAINPALENQLDSIKAKSKTLVVYLESSPILLAISGDPNLNLVEYLQKFSKNVKEGKIMRAYQVDKSSLPEDIIKL